MKKLKRVVSLCLAFAMVSSCFTRVSAAQPSIEDQIQTIVDEKMSIVLPQLAAQDALDQAPLYEEIIYSMVAAEFGVPDSRSAIQPREDGTENNVYAPRGGMVAYKAPRAGFPPQQILAIGCTSEQSAYWLNRVSRQTNVLELLKHIFENKSENAIVAMLPSYMREIANAFLSLAIVGNNQIINDINQCGGRALVINTYWSIDNAASTAVMGWNSMSIPVPYNALEITPAVNP